MTRSSTPSSSTPDLDALLAGVPGGKHAVLATALAAGVWICREGLFHALEKATCWAQVCGGMGGGGEGREMYHPVRHPASGWGGAVGGEGEARGEWGARGLAAKGQRPALWPFLANHAHRPRPTTTTPHTQGQPARRARNAFLKDNFAPVPAETATPVPLTPASGALPPALAGAFMRVGPNDPLPPTGDFHWFDGAGLVHAVRMQTDGTATYASHFVRTTRLAAEGLCSFFFP